MYYKKVTKFSTPNAFKRTIVLLVEDDEMLAETLMQQFVDFGCEVLHARNGREALEIVSKNQISVIMSDIKMPEMSGIQMMDKLNEKNSKVPVIVMTGYSEYQDDDVAKRGGAVLLQKPFTRQQIQELVDCYISLLPIAN